MEGADKMKIKGLMVLITIFLSGCVIGASDKDAELILWSGTTEYTNKVNGFHVSISDALNFIEISAKTNKPHTLYRDPVIIIGDEYFFPRFLSKTSLVVLRGYYVNGNTGDVRYLESIQSIKHKQKWVDKKMLQQKSSAGAF